MPYHLATAPTVKVYLQNTAPGPLKSICPRRCKPRGRLHSCRRATVGSTRVAASPAGSTPRRRSPLPVRIPARLRVLGARGDVQRATLSVEAIGDIQVRSMQALGIALSDAVWIAATARGLRQPALDHGFSGLEESLKEPLLPTHYLILRYGGLVWVSREK